MRRPLAFLAIAFAGLAGCHTPFRSGDPARDEWNARAWQEGRAMVGKEYILMRSMLVCPEASAVNDPSRDWQCRMRGGGKIRVEDAVLNNRDDTILHLAGDVSGFSLYRADMPKPFTAPADYFGAKR